MACEVTRHGSTVLWIAGNRGLRLSNSGYRTALYAKKDKNQSHLSGVGLDNNNLATTARSINKPGIYNQKR